MYSTRMRQNGVRLQRDDGRSIIWRRNESLEPFDPFWPIHDAIDGQLTQHPVAGIADRDRLTRRW
jgi:hypothetical protein